MDREGRWYIIHFFLFVNIFKIYEHFVKLMVILNFQTFFMIVDIFIIHKDLFEISEYF